jgi:hypothetical protein
MINKIILLGLSVWFLSPVSVLAQESRTQTAQDLRINEIMYDLVGSDTDKEWIELQNIGLETVTIQTGLGETGLRILDGTSRRVISVNFVGDGLIDPLEYVIVAQDIEAFLENHPDYTGDIFEASALSLANAGDDIGLTIGSSGQPWDSVSYLSVWGGSGNTKSLEKIDVVLENTDDNWSDSYEIGGSPGSVNNRTPSAPSGLSEDTDNLSWSESTDPDGHTITYTVKVYDAFTNNLITSSQTMSTTQPLSILGLTSNDYYFNVTASDGVLSSMPSDTHFFIYTAPPVPIKYKTVRINELLPDPVSPKQDSKDEAIELYNYGKNDVDLSGWKLQDLIGSTNIYVFGPNIMKPLSYLSIYSSTSKISMNNDGDKIQLFDSSDELISSTPNYGKAKAGQSFMRLKDGTWSWGSPTLNKVNVSDLITSGAALGAQSSDQPTSSTSQLSSVSASSYRIYTEPTTGLDYRLKPVLVSIADTTTKSHPIIFHDSQSNVGTSWTWLAWLGLIVGGLGMLIVLFYPWQDQEK